MEIKFQYRQGDVLLLKAEGVDLTNATPIKPQSGCVILALGEVTGHSHTMTAETVTMTRLFDGREVIVVDELTALMHQEHAPIEIERGMYLVVHQVEYTPERIQRVID